MFGANLSCRNKNISMDKLNFGLQVMLDGSNIKPDGLEELREEMLFKIINNEDYATAFTTGNNMLS